MARGSLGSLRTSSGGIGKGDFLPDLPHSSSKNETNRKEPNGSQGVLRRLTVGSWRPDKSLGGPTRFVGL